jgi:hypothetical protein
MYSNFELAKLFNPDDYPSAVLEIQEKFTGKIGVASIGKDGLIYLWYGNDDGSDDKAVTPEVFNTQFFVTAINLVDGD